MKEINLESIREDKNFIEKFGMEEGSDFKLLGHGEYNINYTFYSKEYGKDLVLRIAIGSQMDLKEQIKYEYQALKLLEVTNRTPKALYYDSSKEKIPYGFLVMEFLPGRPLNYKKDLKLAAEILSDIHKVPVPKENHLIKPANGIEEIYRECLSMFKVYKTSDYKDSRVVERIENLLEKGRNIRAKDVGSRTLINTELNSGNFLINEGGRSYLVDWEKPLYAYGAQDLGHFLAPTTSFWKTDTILSGKEIDFFINEYYKNAELDISKKVLASSVKDYISINCLRGITWCSMAYVQYQDPDKVLTDQYTFEKIKTYLTPEFLDTIKDEYMDGY